MLPLAVALVVLIAPGARAVTLEPFASGPAYQYRGHSNGAYVSWAQNSAARPNRWNAYAIPAAGGTRIRLNAGGTKGVAGGFDPASNTVIYQQFTSRGSDLYLYDLDSSVRTSVGGVNTARWEWNPEISDRSVLFGRWVFRANEQRIMIYDRVGDQSTQLDAVDVDRGSVFPGQVGERYATWTRCNRRTCFALFYDADTGLTTRIPSVEGRPQYAPVIDEATEQAYFVRSRDMRCGRGIRILRAPLSSLATATVVVALPRGIDTEWDMSLAPNPVAGTDLWFGRYRCRARDGDVYVARDIGSG